MCLLAHKAKLHVTVSSACSTSSPLCHFIHTLLHLCVVKDNTILVAPSNLVELSHEGVLRAHMQPLVYLQLGSLMTDFIVPMDLKATNELKRYAVWSVEAALCVCVYIRM